MDGLFDSYDQEDEGDEELADLACKTCSHCHTSGLHWNVDGPPWHLEHESGETHVCDTSNPLDGF